MIKIGVSERPDWPLAVIVGAGGMAMAIARRLGQSSRLLLLDRDGDHASNRAEQLRADGYDAEGLRCDVTKADDVRAVAKHAAGIGPVKTVANVVGLSPSMGDFHAVMDVNIVGATRIGEAFLEVISPGGCAIYISSMAGHMRPMSPEEQALLDDPLVDDFFAKLEAVLTEPLTPELAYLLSKAALNRMCCRRARDWGQRGARIVSLSPGLIASPMGAFEFERRPAKYDLLNATPLQREGTMLEIANAVEFLASDKASFISGTDLLVDGGLTGTLLSGAGK